MALTVLKLMPDNLQSQVQSENVEPLIQKVLCISRQQEENIVKLGTLLSMGPCVTVQVAHL